MMRSGKRGGQDCCGKVWIEEKNIESEDTEQESTEFDDIYSGKEEEQDSSNFIPDLKDSDLSYLQRESRSDKTVLLEVPRGRKRKRLEGTDLGLPEGWGSYLVRSLMPGRATEKEIFQEGQTIRFGRRTSN